MSGAERDTIASSASATSPIARLDAGPASVMAKSCRRVCGRCQNCTSPPSIWMSMRCARTR
jgi:hypothetical protein